MKSEQTEPLVASLTLEEWREYAKLCSKYRLSKKERKRVAELNARLEVER